MKYNQISKERKEKIENEVKKLEQRYSFDEVRLVANNYFNRVKEQRKLEKQIKEKEKELESLKKKSTKK